MASVSESNNVGKTTDGSSDWQSLKRQASGVVNLAVGHPHADALPNTILANAFQRAARNLTEDPSVLGSTESKPSALVNMSYIARRGDPHALHTLAGFLTDAYSEVGRGDSTHDEPTTSDAPTTSKYLYAQSVVTSSSLLLAAGASHALDVACAALTQPGDTVVVETPTYFLAEDVFRDRKLNVVAVPGAGLMRNTDDEANHSSFDVSLFENELRAGLRPKLVYLVPTHGNPRGGTLPLGDRKRLIKLARAFDFYIVADEVYHLLSWGRGVDAPPKRFVEAERIVEREENDRDKSTPDSNDAHDADDLDDPYADPVAASSSHKNNSNARVVSLGSFSKILAPGMRLGWIESHPTLINTLANRGYLSSGGSISPLAASIAMSVIESGEQEVWLARLQERYKSAAAALSTAVALETKETKWILHTKSNTTNAPSGGYFAWLALPETCDMDELAVQTEKHQVAVLRGDRCVAGGRDDNDVSFLASKQCVRLCFAYLDEDEIVEGVRRLARAVRAATM